MQDMRRLDVWIGRAVAAAGVVYVVLASAWPFAADAAPDGRGAVSVVASSIDGPGRLVDLGLARLVADVAARRERRMVAASADAGGLEASARVAREIAVLPPWSLASDLGREPGTPDAPLPSFATLAVAAAIAISACALRDSRRTVMAFDVR